MPVDVDGETFLPARMAGRLPVLRVASQNLRRLARGEIWKRTRGNQTGVLRLLLCTTKEDGICFSSCSTNRLSSLVGDHKVGEPTSE